MCIEPQDAAKIRPYLKRASQLAELPSLADVAGVLAAIRNDDTVVRLSPVRTTRVREHERRLLVPWLGDTLKTLYEHRCQVCVHDYRPRYGVPCADTRFIRALDQGGEPVSRNLVVLCPNHNAIVGLTQAAFGEHGPAFPYPNGRVEKLTLRDHLLS
jgi:hypothetical protein